MSSIQDKINIIKEVFNTQNEEVIIETLKTIHPVIITYYEMLDENFKNYMISIDDKLPTDFFDIDIDNDIDIFIEIGDATFVCYAEKDYNDYKIITNMVNYYIKTNDINNLQILGNLSDTHFDYDTVFETCIKYNKTEAFNFFLMEYSKYFDKLDICTYEGYYSTFIMKHGDLIDISKAFHEFSIKYPDFNSHFGFDLNTMFNAALEYGREKCMHYAINSNTTSNIDFYDESCQGPGMFISDIFDFLDSILFAIIGKNLNCVQTVFDMFKNQINDNYRWEAYFKFASIYGTLDIIKYMITLKPHLVDEIENFYTNILQFALCEGNLEIVQFAINNGATYSVDMEEFIKEYNSERCSTSYNQTDDYINFDYLLYTSPEDINERIEKCMQYIHNN